MREKEKVEYDQYMKNIERENEIIKEDKKGKQRMDIEDKAKKLFKVGIMKDLLKYS